jgi:hypothetical protein
MTQLKRQCPIDLSCNRMQRAAAQISGFLAFFTTKMINIATITL